jgi:hypothetical protein
MLALVPLAALACARRDQPWDAKTFAYEGALHGGQWIRVRNTNGPVVVREAASGGVRVTAEKRWSGRRPEPVRFVVDSSDSGVTICAMWGKRGGECSESEYKVRGEAWWKRLLYRRKTVNVQFAVYVPAGVRVDVQTVNGKVDVEGAGGEVRARTVNGPVEASTSVGPLRAETVNGPIRAHVGAMEGEGSIVLKTVNGPVTAELPADIGATISLSTVNGRIDSDLPIVMSGGVKRNRLQGTIGDGRHKVSIETVNGSVTLRKS